jgi:hypothetical protein
MNIDSVKDHEYFKNKLMMDYFVELYTGFINKHTQNSIEIILYIPTIPNIFSSTDNLTKLKDKYIIFISNNIRIDVSLNNLLSLHKLDYRIYNYNNFCLNYDHLSTDEKLILDYINQNNSNSIIQVDNSIASLYGSSNSLVMSSNYSKRKPDLVVFIVTNSSQRSFVDGCKKIIDKQWISNNYVCLYDYEPFDNIQNFKCLRIPINPEILFNTVNQSHGIMRLINYKLTKQKSVHDVNTNKLPNTIVLIDNTKEKSLTYKYISNLVKIPITIITNSQEFVNVCEQQHNNISVIIDENIDPNIITNICSYIDSLGAKIKIAVVVDTAVNFNKYIHTNIKYHVVKPFNIDAISDLLDNLNSI